jgi:hypothetical protein
MSSPIAAVLDMVIAKDVLGPAVILHQRSKRTAATIQSRNVLNVAAGCTEHQAVSLMIQTAVGRSGYCDCYATHQTDRSPRPSCFGLRHRLLLGKVLILRRRVSQLDEHVSKIKVKVLTP